LTTPAIKAPAPCPRGVPKLSVLVPAWNAASTIERALDSILEDHRVQLECVVIDDGSTDGTADIVQARVDRDPRVVLVRLAVNGGVSNARNAGLAVACGEWLTFHDADDRMLPGGIAALMRPTADPDVLAVVGQRVWSDGERTWLSPLYDIPDIREPGRKSIATHPGLLYYMSVTGKVFHRSLIEGLRFEGRVLGDQSWAIRALLRAGGQIEVIGDTVFEWSRPRADRPFDTITSVARSSAVGGVEMVAVATAAFRDVCKEIDARIDDETTRLEVKKAYFERLLRSDFGGHVRHAPERRDPATGLLYEALAVFLQSVPVTILSTSDVLITHLLRPPARYWPLLAPSARSGYWKLFRTSVDADRRTARRIAWHRAIVPPFVIAARFDSRAGLTLASALLWVVVAASWGVRRLTGS
jgi:glycosyltransferase involved in cell wall biosynthesis